jgi:hypothetical protein
LEHPSVPLAKTGDESITRTAYVKELTDKALNDYSKNFLDVPEFDSAFYAQAVWQLFFGFIRSHKLISAALAIFVLGPLVYAWTRLGYLGWFNEVWSMGQGMLGDAVDKLPFWKDSPSD